MFTCLSSVVKFLKYNALFFFIKVEILLKTRLLNNLFDKFFENLR